MSRELHIHIYDPPREADPRRPGALSGRLGDPDHDGYTAEPDDPEHDGYTAEPDDPDHDGYTAEPDDPGYDGRSLMAAGRPAVLVETRSGKSDCCSCSCAAGSAEKAKEAPRVGGGTYSGFLIVRLQPGILSRTAEDLCQLACDCELMALTDALRIEPAAPAGERKGVAGFWQELGELFARGGSAYGHCFPSRPLIELRNRFLQLSAKDRPTWSDAPRSRGETIAHVEELERRAALSRFPPLHSLNSYWRVDLRDYPQRTAEVAEKLRAVAQVELVYRELAAVDSAYDAMPGGSRFTEDQLYLTEAPIGISAEWAWETLLKPAAVKEDEFVSSPDYAPPKVPLALCDLEQAWGLSHDNLREYVGTGLAHGQNRRKEGASGHHGAAVFGQVAGSGGQNQGVQGAASGVARFVLSSHYRSQTEETLTPNGGLARHPFAGTNGHVASALVATLVADGPPVQHPLPLPDRTKGIPLQPGDIVLLEVQRGLLPTEIDSADFDAIRLAVGNGIVVIAAAGNGGFDLDAYVDPDSGRSLWRDHASFRDSGALLVGAGRAAVPHDRLPFSNFGSRIDCYGWGEAVTSCGFGDLFGQSDSDFFTNRFNGTSSAAPIVAGAAALLQALHQRETGSRLGPAAMRAALADRATGTPQGPNVAGNIGVMPNLRAIARQVLQLAPDIYLRRTIVDDGSMNGVKGPIAVCQDILLATATPSSGDLTGANFLAPGESFDAPSLLAGAASPLVSPVPPGLYLRLRNGGRGEEEKVWLAFASPAATLITPEHWLPVGELKAKVADGDLPVVGEVQGWTKKTPAAVLDLLTTLPRWNASLPLSFLAVRQERAAGPIGCSALPPGPPYFDWKVFRDFLRSRRVAWRNIHAVRPDPSAVSIALPFLIAGTPDQARHFDFEVVARLPHDARVELEVPQAFAAKLRQNESWIGPLGAVLALPPRPRVRFSNVKVAPEALVAATFRINWTISTGAPLPGQSLALRQLWRGEEVGRVTFYFVP